jgi:hypothetical protein
MGAAYRDIQWNQFREINKHKAVQNQMFLELVCDYRYRLEDTKSVAVKWIITCLSTYLHWG